jgi:hypothetical protein
MAPELVRARDRFQSWRATHRPKSRIPEPLWALAIGLTAAQGLHRAAKTLKLDYYSLQKRVQASQARTKAKGRAFVELPPPVLAGKQCLFELDNGAGTSLRVQLLGYDAADLVALSRSLWNAE